MKDKDNNNITASDNSITIALKNNNGNLFVSARELHKGLEITERFSNWFDRQLQYGFELDLDFTSVKSFTVVNNNAEKELQDYLIKINMAKEICMIQRSEKGRQFRKYFIRCEEQLKNNNALSEKEQLQLSILNGSDMEKITALKQYEELIKIPLLEDIDTMQQDINRMTPKEAYYDSLVCTDNLTTIRDTAKLLGIRERDFVSWLLEHKYIYRNKNKNRTLKPYAQYCGENKLFKLKECNGGAQTYITIKGRQLFQEKLSNKNGDDNNNE